MPELGNGDEPPLKGRSVPRIYTRPLPGREIGVGCVNACDCGLTSDTSDGFRVIEWCRKIGIKLMPWQRWLLVHALELDRTLTTYRFRTVLVLVARQNGKTFLKVLLSLWRMYERGDQYIVGVAQDLSQAREVMTEDMIPIMQENRYLSKRFDPDAELPVDRVGEWHKTLSDEYIRLDTAHRGNRTVGKRGPRYLIKALNRKAGRGLSNVKEVNIDELREQQDTKGWAAISKVVMAADDAQIWCMSNAGDADSVVLNHLRSVGSSDAGEDEDMFLAEWSANVGCDLDDRSEWANANPSLGYPHGVTERAILSALRTDTPSVFRTEVLCQFVDVMNRAVDLSAWNACSDAFGFSARKDSGRMVLCVERAVDRDEIVCCSAVMTDDGKFKVDVVGIWKGVDSTKSELDELREAINPVAIGWYSRGPGSTLSSMMRKMKRTEEIKGEKVSEAHMSFADLIDHRKILHPGDAILDRHVSNASPVGNASSWIMSRSEALDTHGAWAAAGAIQLAAYLPENLKRARTILLGAGYEE